MLYVTDISCITLCKWQATTLYMCMCKMIAAACYFKRCLMSDTWLCLDLSATVWLVFSRWPPWWRVSPRWCHSGWRRYYSQCGASSHRAQTCILTLIPLYWCWQFRCQITINVIKRLIFASKCFEINMIAKCFFLLDIKKLFEVATKIWSFNNIHISFPWLCSYVKTVVNNTEEADDPVDSDGRSQFHRKVILRYLKVIWLEQMKTEFIFKCLCIIMNYPLYVVCSKMKQMRTQLVIKPPKQQV